MAAGYPTPVTSFPAHHVRPPSAGSAETLVLVALILQVVGGAIVLGGIAWLLGFSVLFPYPYVWAVSLAAGAVAVLVVVFLWLAYILSFQRIRRGEYRAAETPTLVIGILSLFCGLLPGIFYLIGYVKLGDAVRELEWGTGPSSSPAYSVGPPQIACRACGRVYPLGAGGYCPNCGQKLGP
jgi:hypothetical protein